MKVTYPMMPLCSKVQGRARRRIDPLTETTGVRKNTEATMRKGSMKIAGMAKTKKGKTGRIAGKLQAPATNPIIVVSLRTRPIPLQLARTESRIPPRNSSPNRRKTRRQDS